MVRSLADRTFQLSSKLPQRIRKLLGRHLEVLRQRVDGEGHGERSVGQIQPLVGLSQSALSQHLAVLREEGIVASRREATSLWYRIADPAALKVVGTLAEIFCPPTESAAHDHAAESPEA